MLTPSLCQIFVFPGIQEIIAGASLHSNCECFYLYEMWPSIAIFEVSYKQLSIFLWLIFFFFHDFVLGFFVHFVHYWRRVDKELYRSTNTMTADSDLNGIKGTFSETMSACLSWNQCKVHHCLQWKQCQVSIEQFWKSSLHFCVCIIYNAPPQHGLLLRNWGLCTMLVKSSATLQCAEHT